MIHFSLSRKKFYSTLFSNFRVWRWKNCQLVKRYRLVFLIYNLGSKQFPHWLVGRPPARKPSTACRCAKCLLFFCPCGRIQVRKRTQNLLRPQNGFVLRKNNCVFTDKRRFVLRKTAATWLSITVRCHRSLLLRFLPGVCNSCSRWVDRYKRSSLWRWPIDDKLSLILYPQC